MSIATWGLMGHPVLGTNFYMELECGPAQPSLFQECIKSGSSVFHKHFKIVSRVVKECFVSVLRPFQECFKVICLH